MGEQRRAVAWIRERRPQLQGFQRFLLEDTACRMDTFFIREFQPFQMPAYALNMYAIWLDWNKANIEKHWPAGILPREVSEAFANEAIDLGYEVVNGEERWTSMGHTKGMRIPVVVWTMQGDAIRPVTAFEAGSRLAAESVREKRMAEQSWLR